MTVTEGLIPGTLGGGEIVAAQLGRYRYTYYSAFEPVRRKNSPIRTVRPTALSGRGAGFRPDPRRSSGRFRVPRL